MSGWSGACMWRRTGTQQSGPWKRSWDSTQPGYTVRGVPDDSPSRTPSRRRYVYQGNPKDQRHGAGGPDRPRRPQPLTPPAARLRRLGATARALAAYRKWWEGLEDDIHRKAALGILGLLTDTALARQVADVDALADLSVARVDAWVRNQPNRALAVGLALAAEQERDGGPRDSLVKKLGAGR